MKIGLVLSATPSYSETFFISKIKGLQSNGHEVILFVQHKTVGFDACDVQQQYPIAKNNVVKQGYYFLLGFVGLFFIPKQVLKFWKLEKKSGRTSLQTVKNIYVSSHILTQKLDWLHFGFATMSLGKENVAHSIGAKMAVSFRGFDMAIYPIKFSNCYDLLWQRVDQVHTISDDLLKLAYKEGLPKNIPVYKITPAIDTEYFKPLTSSSNIIEPIKILTVARLHWKKGGRDTLLAMRQLKNNHIDFEYTIVGDGEQYEELMYLIDQFGLENHVFLVGKKSLEEVKRLYESHQIYVQYSVSEGFCNAVLEAQAMQLLCVVSDAEGLSENVLHEKTGWVVSKKKPNLLAEKMIDVINLTNQQKKQIRSSARSRVENNFTIEKQQEEFHEFYKK